MDSALRTQHGMTYTPVYSSWRAMRKRLRRPSREVYETLDIDPRWAESFEAFYADMGDRPNGKSLDRIDNTLGYWPDNCRWATAKEQMRNTSVSQMFEHEGVTQPLRDWADLTGTNPHTLRYRIRNGWSSREVLYGKDS